MWEKNKNKRKEAKFGPFFKKNSSSSINCCIQVAQLKFIPQMQLASIGLNAQTSRFHVRQIVLKNVN